MSDPDRPGAEVSEDSWDLIPDERAPSRSIIMRFATREAAHGVLTQAGYSPISGSEHLLRHRDGRMAVRYVHPDGSTAVLAHPVAEQSDPQLRPKRLGAATVEG